MKNLLELMNSICQNTDEIDENPKKLNTGTYFINRDVNDVQTLVRINKSLVL